MMEFWPRDWSAILVPEGPIAELIVRATLIYFFLFAVMRAMGRRLFTKLAMADALVILLIAVAVREGITGGYKGVGDAAILGATLLAWNRIIDALVYHVPFLRKPLRHRPLPIIRDGEVVQENVSRTLITASEIEQILREKGLASASQVQEAHLEPDGSISVLRR